MNEHNTGATANPTAEHSTLQTVRRLLLGILAIGSAGTLLELGLLEHTEDRLQWIPLVLLSAVLVSVMAHQRWRRRATIRSLQAVMVACVLSGFVGIWRHYSGNVEFALEMRASLAGWDLFRESIGGAFPVLAPGTMIWIGLLGLVYTYRHPLLRRPNH